MAELVSPISGGIRVVKSRISPAAFTGKFIPPAPVQPQSDPIVTGLIRANTAQLERVSQSIDGINSQIVSVDTTLRAVLNNLETNQSLDRQRERQEQNQQRVLSQQRVLKGKENAIEKKIQSALVAPIQKIAPKVQSSLNTLMGSLTTVLGGWLINQGLEAFKAKSEDNQEKLEEIKNSTLLNLGLIGGILVAVNGGLNVLVGSLARLGKNILRIAAKGLFVSLPIAIFNFIKENIPGLGKKPPAATTPPVPPAAAPTTKPQPTSPVPPTTKPQPTSPVPPTTKPQPTPPVPPTTKPQTPKPKTSSFGGFGWNLGLGFLSELLSGESLPRATTGAATGATASTAATSLVGKLPLPPLVKIPLVFGTGALSYYFGSEFGKGTFENLFEGMGQDSTTDNNISTNEGDQARNLNENLQIAKSSVNDSVNLLNEAIKKGDESFNSSLSLDFGLSKYMSGDMNLLTNNIYNTSSTSDSDEPDFKAPPSSGRVDLNADSSESTSPTPETPITSLPTSTLDTNLKATQSSVRMNLDINSSKFFSQDTKQEISSLPTSDSNKLNVKEVETSSEKVNLDMNSLKPPTETPKAQISPLPTSSKGDKVSQNLASLKEPAPTVISIPSPSGGKKKAPPAAAGGISGSYIPFLATSDASNIYAETTKSLFGVLA